jgi:voltage-gated potassium channel
MDGVGQTSTPEYMTDGLARWRRATDLPLLVVAIGSLPLLLLELERSDLTRGDRRFLDLTNLVVLAAFAIDYVVEFALARRRATFARREWTSLVIVITQAVAVVPALTGFGLLRALRGARALRGLVALVRLFAIGGAAAQQGRGVLRRHAASFALALAALTWLTSAAAFTLAEDVGDGHRIHSFFDALWWSTTTITTVGYGDIYPVTAAGRIVGGLTMVVGISAFAVVTAKVAEFLVRAPAPDDDHLIPPAENR